MSGDLEALQKEIETLRDQKAAAQDRIQLYSQRGRGRGRGRGFHAGRGQDGRSDRSLNDDRFGRRDSQQEKAEADDRRDSEDRAERDESGARKPADGLSASLRARLGSRSGQDDKSQDQPFRPNFNRDEHDHRVGKAHWKRRIDNSYNREEEEAAAPSNAEPLPGSNTSRLASAVVTSASQPVEEFTRRPTVNGAANPETKKRNKRLFGALLGTLQQFQEEDQRFKRSRLAQTRAEAESRAAAKAVENERNLKEKHRQDLAKARVGEINKKKELELQLQAKEYEMIMVKKLAQDMHLGLWLKTAAAPPVLWMPKVHNTNTRLLLEQRQIELDAWQEEQKQKIEKHKQSILDRYRPVAAPMPRPMRQETVDTEMIDQEAEPGQVEENGIKEEQPDRSTIKEEEQQQTSQEEGAIEEESDGDVAMRN